MRRFFFMVALLLLAGCSGPRLPFEKDLPADNNMVAPPWEALVQAGPGAEKELDLETLNGPSTAQLPPPLIAETEAAGLDDAPAKTDTKKLGKNAVAIKAVALPAVQGALGQGNAELATAMRAVLREAGWPVVSTPAANALTIRGKVKITRAGATDLVKLQWIVTTPDGKVLGDVSQANSMAAGSLNKGWGENARFASEAAATGIFKLIQNYR